VAYKGKQLVIQTMSSSGGCGYGELVNIDKPNVDPEPTNGDSFYLSSSTCNNWSFQVQLYNNASGNKPAPGTQLPDNPSACVSATASDPNPGTDNAKTGDSFCVASTDGLVAHVTIVSVDAQGDVTLQLDGWNTGGPVAVAGAPTGAAYTAAYQSTQLTIQTMSSSGGCGYGELVNIDKPNVDPQPANGDSFYLSSSTCNNWSFQVQLYNNASGNKPAPGTQLPDNPSACVSAIASDPNPGTDNAKTGDSFCVASTDGFLAYVKIVSVDAQGDVKLQLNGWSTTR
jgi:hypothetical protein